MRQTLRINCRSSNRLSPLSASREGLKKNYWTLAPEVKPDVYEADLIKGKPHKVTFITDIDSISFMVGEGKKYDFIVQRGDDLCYTQIVGKTFIAAAVFDKK